MKNLEEFFVKYPLAKRLKEKGFQDGVFAYFKENKYKPGVFELWPSQDPEFQVKHQRGEQNKHSELGLISAPTYEQVTEWLRTTHRIDVDVHPNGNGEYHSYVINNDVEELFEHKKYYPALIKAINRALELI